mmetsp:Transcript_12622/g.31025  ORF Transcript_12622/g.31025 Transcript_12622/m.31025 type:complete len:273 (-) Transcript_12622:559-1377(-)|eukprot:CAMPEP_0114487928 /NCGR_PEP_ID=MMETSP0109-20121206/1042_1 /TAXON_ID=29199 /ORGANISM="Chlorarachnion reptans, Strain CCCM449" /LENGTH=272 /DNA_ID=CAMNT_0001664255 /DNA_START=333 /DNA_END=1151 /DNA_ORIENTATION=-
MATPVEIYERSFLQKKRKERPAQVPEPVSIPVTSLWPHSAVKRSRTPSVKRTRKSENKGTGRKRHPKSPSKNIGSELKITSKYTGVSYHANRGKWQVKIRSNGKQKHLGYFEDEIEAARAYNRAAREVHSNPKLNVIPEEDNTSSSYLQQQALLDMKLCTLKADHRKKSHHLRHGESATPKEDDTPQSAVRNLCKYVKPYRKHSLPLRRFAADDSSESSTSADTLKLGDIAPETALNAEPHMAMRASLESHALMLLSLSSNESFLKLKSKWH